MIPSSEPDVGERELASIRETFEDGNLSLGPKTLEFQNEFAETFGHSNVVATNSCTAALDLAIKSAGLDGTEILIPPLTWISTAHVVKYNDYDIGWVDVEADTLNMSPESLAETISDDTAAVIPVHYGGQAARIDEIVDIAHEYDAVVIEDAAHAPGITYKDEPIGKIGDIGCFSFQGTKVMTTGEGGALVTEDDDIAEEIDRLVKLGLNKSSYERYEDGDGWYYEVSTIGYKYWMNDMQASMGIVQLERLPDMLARRNEIAETYDRAFESLDWIEPLATIPESTHARYNYTVLVPAGVRDDVVAYLRDNEVSASVQYIPVYKHDSYHDHDPDLPTTESVWERIVTLPMSSRLSDADVETVIETVEAFSESM